jgi:hypothetical protein
MARCNYLKQRSNCDSAEERRSCREGSVVPIVQVREGQLFFACHVMQGPVFRTRQETQDWCTHTIFENDYRGGPIDEATIRIKVEVLEQEGKGHIGTIRCA